RPPRPAVTRRGRAPPSAMCLAQQQGASALLRLLVYVSYTRAAGTPPARRFVARPIASFLRSPSRHMKPSAVRPSLLFVVVVMVSALLAAPSAAQACPRSLWPPPTVPANLRAKDPNAVELGVRFRAATNGTISAIRFFKSADNV